MSSRIIPPVRDVAMIKSKAVPKGAAALTAEQLRELLTKLRASETCVIHARLVRHLGTNPRGN